MLRLSVPLSFLTFGLLPLYILNYWLFSKRIQQSTTILRSRMDHISSMLQERLSAHELIQSYGQEQAEARYFSSYNKQIMDASIKGAAYSISFNQLSAFINKIGNTLIYCLGCYYFVKESMGYGDVVAFCAYATQLLGPVVRFSSVANQIVQVGVSVDRINAVLAADPGIVDVPDAEPIAALQGEIDIDGVSFEYDEGEPVLKDVRLRIPAGTHLAVVGAPGAGRSTLAMLLRRYYEPKQGRIRVDGKSIRKYRLKDYRTALALVLPESTIFDGTIRENLLYGKPEATPEQMITAAKAVGLHPFVEELSDGYDTRLGAGGMALAAGDRQRIGIARALISRPLVLVADEATASLDPESAGEIGRAIRDAMEGRTYLLIASRLLMARDADRVVVMHKGKAVEEGTHAELLVRRESVYRDLYGKQYGEERLPPPAADVAPVAEQPDTGQGAEGGAP
jgi:ABC-type multidrug transport system fused ATPase/permease subunit